MDGRIKAFLTPKDLADALGVSESSLKRWCDRGLIPMVRTAGGHRKLPISGVLSFLRETQHELVSPELLGLPATRAAVVSRAASCTISPAG